MTFLLKSPCPVCHGHCELVDVLDLHKMCGDPGLHFRGLSGQPIYYALCQSCGFCFAPTIAQWGHQEFEDRIYNQDYIQVDPEYVEIRPQGFRTRLLQLFGGYSDGNPPDRPKVREVEFSKKEVLREEVKIYRQPDHGCLEAC